MRIAPLTTLWVRMCVLSLRVKLVRITATQPFKSKKTEIKDVYLHFLVMGNVLIFQKNSAQWSLPLTPNMTLKFGFWLDIALRRHTLEVLPHTVIQSIKERYINVLYRSLKEVASKIFFINEKNMWKIFAIRGHMRFSC